MAGTERRIDPVDLLLWTFRRSTADVIRMYRALSDVMRLAGHTDMLNFGCWDGGASTPLSAQRRLCTRLGRAAGLSGGQRIADIGSGYGAPALRWASEHDRVRIFSVNTVFEQLAERLRTGDRYCSDDDDDYDDGGGVPPPSAGGSRPCTGSEAAGINASACTLPFAACSVDRVLALESAQHFRPLSDFASESYRILRDGGRLAMAVPVVSKKGGGAPHSRIAKLGLLSLTWSSEHYTEEHVVSSAVQAGFETESVERIGHLVYGPLAEYYEENRARIREDILRSYPPYVERILHMSIRKMGRASRENVIDYVLAVLRKG